MALLVGAFLVSLVPSVALYLWLKDHMNGGDPYKRGCRRALAYGALAGGPVLLVTFVLRLVWGLAGLGAANPIVDAAYKDIVSIALSEELCKYLMFRRVLAKEDRPISWLEMIAVMTIVGIGFGLMEDIPYALMTNAGQMLVRGITVGHGSYGFIMGYLMGKAKATGDNKWAVLGFVIPWVMHGLYDFGLSEAVDAYFLPGFLSVSLAVADLAIIIYMIFFMRRARNDEKYTG